MFVLKLSGERSEETNRLIEFNYQKPQVLALIKLNADIESSSELFLFIKMYKIVICESLIKQFC